VKRPKDRPSAAPLQEVTILCQESAKRPKDRPSAAKLQEVTILCQESAKRPKDRHRAAKLQEVTILWPAAAEEVAMVELKKNLENLRLVNVPYTLRLLAVTEEMFDELVDEDIKAELLDGVMIVHSPASLRHDDVGGFVRSLMRFFARHKQRGRVLGPDSLIRLTATRKFAPDIFFIKEERVPHPLPDKCFEGAPDLVVEILSPSNRKEDLEDKRPAYRKAGVRELWFIDPDEQECLIDRKQQRGYKTTQVSEGRVVSTVLTGFWLDLAWLWAEDLPNDMDCLTQILS
jgi:Uma2 family endonuclease